MRNEDKISKVVDGLLVYYDDETVPDEELKAYVARAKKKFILIDYIDLHFDGDEVEILYGIPKVGFNRIRRITGYLVGSMNTWNDAKRSEEEDRVKHTV